MSQAAVHPTGAYPTGTVTFLFTDIQGSTKLWEAHPEAMRAALARHDTLMRQSIEAQQGYVFKTVGDAFCAAFPTANQAFQAALAAQLGLTAEPWEVWNLPTPLRVRMGLHTGSAEERGGDYFGQPLNRVARLMGTAHGGQTVFSEVTHGLVRDALPPHASLLNLGAHRLKDLGRPEIVFQLLHPSLQAEFPPLHSLDNPALPNNLPQQATSFIGRERQVEEVKALLAKTRLLTLTGAGGSGKTRLALQVAAELLGGKGDGVWLVELAGLSDPALVPQAVVDVLGVREAASKSVGQALSEWLRPKRLLLILDNCEHLVGACAALAADLLRTCPGVRLLASSREPLNVTGEQTYRVPTLSLPDSKQPQTAKNLTQYEAVRLFIERAQAVQPAFHVTDASAPAVAQVCWRLDGIPLAIELAAARSRALSADEINRRLDQRFRLLTGGSRDRLPRQQTLRALIDWSYDLLTEPEKSLLCRLSVFAGGWTLAAAEAVCSGEPVEDWEVLDLLTFLVDKSLVVYEGVDGQGGQGRMRLLETVRQYAGDRLQESGSSEAMLDRAASWFLRLAAEAAGQMLGPEQAAWLEKLETEHDNLRASLSWYEREEKSASGEAGLRLAVALCRFWATRGHFSEGRQWLGKALGRMPENTSGQEVATGFAAEALALRGKALSGAGSLARNQGDYAGAWALLEEAVNIRRRLGDRQGLAISLNNLGNVAESQGDYAAARVLYEESLMICRQLENQGGVAIALNNVGLIAERQGDYAGAQALYEESLMLSRQLGYQGGIAISLNSLGVVAERQGDYAAARALYEESLILSRQLGYQQGIAENLECMAGAATGLNQMVRAARLGGAVSSLRETIGYLRSPMEQEKADKLVSSGRTALGEEAFTVA